MGTLKLRIRFAACEACAKSVTRRLAVDQYARGGIWSYKVTLLNFSVDLLGPKLKKAPALSEPLIIAM